MPVSHSLKTTGIFYTRKYFSITKNRNQRFFLLIVFLLKIPSANFVIPARSEPIRKGEMGDYD
jgi:hypothetical protein